MLRYKPHTVTVAPKSGTVSSSELTGYAAGSGVSVRGQVTEKTPQQALEMFGVVLSNPAVFLFEIADVASVKIGFVATLNGRSYWVAAGPQIMDAEPRTAHARVLLERNT